MSVLCLVHGADDELSQQAVAFASGLRIGDVRAVAIEGAFTPAAWAQTLIDLADGADAITAPAPTAATRCSPTWRPSSISRWPPT